jgi:hypothetical protein
MPDWRAMNRPATPDAGEPNTPNPWDIHGGSPGFRLMILSVASLFGGGVISVAARSFAASDQLIGFALAGLLLLAPLPMLAGDAIDALLLRAASLHWLSLDGYRRTASLAVPGAVIVAGLASYPVVLAIGGEELLGVVVVVGAFILFGALPVGAWLVRRLRRPRSDS